MITLARNSVQASQFLLSPWHALSLPRRENFNITVQKSRKCVPCPKPCSSQIRGFESALGQAWLGLGAVKGHPSWVSPRVLPGPSLPCQSCPKASLSSRTPHRVPSPDPYSFLCWIPREHPGLSESRSMGAGRGPATPSSAFAAKDWELRQSDHRNNCVKQ